MDDNAAPPAVKIPGGDAQAAQIKPEQLQALGRSLAKTFKTFANDRQETEQKWLRNLRQYLGIYDPEILEQIKGKRSTAYPRVTRVKVISVLSRIMNLMFPGNERNWEIKASPNAEMAPEDVQQAVDAEVEKRKKQQINTPITQEVVDAAVQKLADDRAALLASMIDDQLQELGGDQSLDYVALNHKVAKSGIMYGVGAARGPFVKAFKKSTWSQEAGRMVSTEVELYKPQFEFLPCWDFYPDMSATTLDQQDGYFIRLVMSRGQLQSLKKREDFFKEVIQKYLTANTSGTYKPQQFETELRSMGTKSNVSDQTPSEKADTGKYEVIVWHGPVSGKTLSDAGVNVPEDAMADDVEAEIWLLEDQVIKADMNPWHRLDVPVKTLHTFVFDEDDTGPVGNGLPNVVRDSQMSICAATRMLMDNASVVCGPIMEVNLDMLAPGEQTQLDEITSYATIYREGNGPDAAFPAVRQLQVDGFLNELMALVQMFMQFADMETFVGPATGGDMSQAPSEPMRTAAGASMMRGDAALPFKDIVRNFDRFTQSVITSLVHFNKAFNPGKGFEGDYNIIARGATSLIAKEVRGMQVDQLATTLSDREWEYIDEEKLVEARLSVRDMGNLLASPDEITRRKDASAQRALAAETSQKDMMAAEIRKTLSEAFKNIAQGQKNSAGGDATIINAALKILESNLDGNQDDTGVAKPAAPARAASAAA